MRKLMILAMAAVMMAGIYMAPAQAVERVGQDRAITERGPGYRPMPPRPYYRPRPRHRRPYRAYGRPAPRPVWVCDAFGYNCYYVYR